ncbi:winged helix-turn-helix transcriptional regulator [Actinomyces sp.]|uniref:winged helix-turn-helix transcriptional regulator n=1 Tax=Actinomyces sp. TaxID=29317 RepID=UPI0034C69976
MLVSHSQGSADRTDPVVTATADPGVGRGAGVLEAAPDPVSFRPLSAYDVLSPDCPSRTVLRHVVDRWTPLIVAVLARGPHRFGELRQAVGGVTPKVLAQTLRSMERDGLVLREQTPGVPPRVDYTLTGLGAGLAEPIAALRAWAEGNAEQVLAHRESYDRAHPRLEG